MNDIRHKLLEKINEINTIFADDDNKCGGYHMTEYFNNTAPEDYCEERIDWRDLQSNADDMYYMLNEIRCIVEQMKDEIEADILIN